MDPTQDIQNIQNMYGQMGGANGSVPPPPAPESMQPERTEISAPPKPPTGNSDVGHKKALLQRLMSNLLSKPGRSMHEIINGVKDAIGAYKNYAKEWDNLSGAVGGAVGGAVSGAAGGIQDILRMIQQKKGGQDGAGGPGNMPTGNPNGMPIQARGVPALGNPVQRPAMPQMPAQMPAPPTMPQAQLIAGQPQVSSFNRPPPVSTLGIWGR